MGFKTLDPDADPSTYQVNSSLTTIFSLINSMIGGTMLLLPNLFIESGLVLAEIILLISGFISYKTVSLYLVHMKTKEMDIYDPVQRILDMITFIMNKCGNNNYVQDENQFSLNFDEFSQQWLCIIYFFPLLGMLFLKDMSLLTKIAGIGVYAIYSYLIFIFYAFFSNLDNMKNNGQENHVSMPMVTSNIGNLAGTIALAFTIHTNFGPMIKCSKNQKNNERDIRLIFLFGCIIYTIIGWLGSYGILSIHLKIILSDRRPGEEHTYITDYFKGNYGSFIVWILYFGHLISVYPIFLQITRGRILKLIYKENEPPYSTVVIINLTFLIFCMIIKNIPNIKPDTISNFIGAVLCFFIIYMVPIMLHIICYHGEDKFYKKIQRKISQFTERGYQDHNLDDHDHTQNNINDNLMSSQMSYEDSMIEKNDQHIQANESNQKQNKQSDKKTKQRKISCAPHEDEQIGWVSFKMRIVFYSIIGLLGIAVLVYGLYTSIKGFM